ncbi:hypothetical protein [Planomonospora parontospora]|uniref:hypothetical protein n=1 Tax=Planomonospora parontospora TaxID=58119 RepID=UPI0016700733|nr:hypothetical protein [Planomonospora parontospora]GGL56668.1 hypothetical protein GCM10014719_67620 [Planomonospora parontospora subsp. antibiotica]GII19952.1 hypothetical protein Ppa05_66780 [Planomonospora parontospora subsp. antibiotica]
MSSDHEENVSVYVRATYSLDGRTCAWCREMVPYSGRGRPAVYCSKACRNRAWEVRSAERRLQRDIAAGVLRTEPVRELIRETVTETRTVTVRPKPPAPPKPAKPSPEPGVPTSARAWIALLEALGEQLRDGELGRQHWHHARLYNALVEAVVDLGDAYPGGLDYLRNEVTRRRS